MNTEASEGVISTRAPHTPGPWQALPPAKWEGEDGQWIVPGVAHCGKGELSEGNARLIAAALDLLAVVQERLEHCNTRDADGIEHEWARKARAAIAKATNA